jgi:hypothetical protein
MFGDPSLAAVDGDDPRDKPANKPIFNDILEKLMDLFPSITRIFELILANLS